MNSIIRRPYQRPLLTMLAAAILSGCSGLQTNVVYKTWEEKAYSAYKLATPVYKNGILPEIARVVSESGRKIIIRPAVQHTIRPLPVTPVANHPVIKNNSDELQYIAQHYGL